MELHADVIWKTLFRSFDNSYNSCFMSLIHAMKFFKRFFCSHSFFETKKNYGHGTSAKCSKCGKYITVFLKVEK